MIVDHGTRRGEDDQNSPLSRPINAVEVSRAISRTYVEKQGSPVSSDTLSQKNMRTTPAAPGEDSAHAWLPVHTVQGSDVLGCQSRHAL